LSDATQIGPGLVVYRDTGGVDAIAEHSRRLVAALEEAGHPARYVEHGLGAARRSADGPPWILLQYNPFSFCHWGVAPRLLPDALLLRRRTGALFAILVHEPWGDRYDWRSTLMTAYQRVQLRSLLLAADVVMATTQGRARMLHANALHVPVGSNITPVGATARAARARLGFSDELVVALFGTGHPSRALGEAEAAIDALADTRGAGSLRVLNLGRGAPPLRVRAGVVVDDPGQLDAEELSWRLSASDLLLLPFTDGVSTRRTTLMAGLAHGVPVVGSRGTNTDDVLVRHPDALVLSAAGDAAAFARAATGLAVEHDRLRAVGEAGRRLYLSHFDWPVTAGRVASALLRTP
jgi:glycosyltransferase involved in cell wall biosynthesis